MQKKKGKKNNKHGKGRKDADRGTSADEGGLSDDQKPEHPADQCGEEHDCGAEDHHHHHHHNHGCCGHDHDGPEPSNAVPAAPRELVTTFVCSDRCGVRHNLPDTPSKYIMYEQYKSEEQLPRIMEMMTADLSEPYSIFTYRYFINNWPDLCFLAVLHDEEAPEERRVIGSIVCKLDYHKGHTNPQRCIRGYIAMLVVEQAFRKHGLGSTLARYAIETMTLKNCDEVVLETEVTNSGALRLYENLGFVRDKRLQRYYLNGVDAFRLKLWLTPFLL